jgi:Uma2 family endonuclease
MTPLAETAELPVLTYEQERGKPMPSKLHCRIQSRLIVALNSNPRFDTYSELSLELGGKKWTPDICLYATAKQDWMNDEILVKEPPLLAVEIFSPSQHGGELMDKVHAYLAAGVKSVWLVSPMMRSVAVYNAGDIAARSFGSGKIMDPALGIEVDYEAVFA